MKKNTKLVKTFAAMGSLVGLIVIYGIGCGVGFQPIGGGQFSAGFATDVGDNGALVIVRGARTVSVSNYTTALDNMVSLTGVAPSATTRQVFNARLGSFSDQGTATTVNAPMLFAYIAVGAEVCNDLSAAEAATPDSSRRFYPAVDLTSNGADAADAAFTDAAIGSSVRRMARQFWQREETTEELNLIRAGVREMINEARSNPGPNNTYITNLSRRASVYLCTAMIASTSAYEI